MNIDIKGLTNEPINSQGGNKVDASTDNNARTQDRSTGAAKSDTVSLTASATQLNALEEQISSLPIVDSNRISETRDAIATGTHQIDPRSTADGLLATERAFAQKG